MNKKLPKFKKEGERFMQVRNALQLEQKQLSEPINYKQGAISMIEKGAAKPGRKLLEALRDTYNINADFILYGKGEMFIGEMKGKEVVDTKIMFEKRETTKTEYMDERLKAKDELIEQLKERLKEKDEMISMLKGDSKRKVRFGS